MKATIIDGAFGLDNLRQIDRPSAPLGSRQVRLRIKAVSLNYRDLLMVSGMYNPKQPLPLVPCSDGVGEIIERGDGCRRFEIGQRVCPIFCQGWIAGPPSYAVVRNGTLGGPLDGTLCQEMVVDEEGLVAVADYLSDAEAATLPCAGVTAWSALAVESSVKAGQTVLVQGSGGVSIFALQLAKLMGCRVIATSSSNEKLERMKALGADETINYRSTPKWGQAARQLAPPEGIDQVIEVGGAQTLEQSLRATRLGGTISLIGVLSGVAAPLNLLPILMQQVRVQGILVGHRQGFEQLMQAAAAHRLHPVVDDRQFGFSQAAEALSYLQSGKHFGKVVLLAD
ncbi:MAG: NAD(P)-dependent alcohol dehydrogenase [Deltaproteobacteria bacterium]|nr:NAD(P)-dependent alcohol dehydrogenase [Deltaproteobacteria bacterium]